MSIRMDPPRTPQPPVAQALAQAAVQRQAMLLGGEREGAAPLPAPEALPGAPAPGTPAVPSQVASAFAQPPLPAQTDRVSLSPQARQGLGDAPSVLAGSGERAGTGAQHTSPLSSQGLGAPSSAAPLLPAWPTSGLPAPLRSMVGAMVQQLTASVLPQQVTRAQPWPADLARMLDGGDETVLPPLQTWLVRQGSVQTPEGARGFSLTLRVPAAWLQAQSPSLAAAPGSAGLLQTAFAGPAQALQSGVVALVLQGAEPAAARTSARLALDFQPQQAAQVYGRDMQMRLDPWVQMAALQASGQVPREEDKARSGERGLCHTPGCPYAGRAECEQPFCLALHCVGAVAPSVALGAEVPDPSVAEPGRKDVTG